MSYLIFTKTERTCKHWHLEFENWKVYKGAYIHWIKLKKYTHNQKTLFFHITSCLKVILVFLYHRFIFYNKQEHMA